MNTPAWILKLYLNWHKLLTSPLTVRVIFVSLLMLGSVVVSDYGVSYDEYVNRKNGGVSLNHILDRVEKVFDLSVWPNDEALTEYRIPLDTYQDRDYGVAFDLPVFALERVLQINNSRSQHLLRHVLTYLFFLSGCWALYKTIIFRFSNSLLGLCSVAIMVMTPRIFADSFYNSKDIVFMSAVAIATYTMQKFFDKKNMATAALFGLATAFAINIRIIGIIFPIAVIAILLVERLNGKKTSRVSLVMFYITIATGLTIAFWPWLWSQPVEHFIQAFSNMSKFRWEGWVLYLGNYYPSSDLPRHYIVTWIGITTPVLYIVLFGIGAIAIGKTMLLNGLAVWKTPEQLQDLIFFGLFFSPLIMVVISKPVIYDGWRQFYFVYPAFICIAIRGLTFTPKRERLVKILPGALFVSLAATLLYLGGWMVAHHPFQNVYFNALASKGSAEPLDLINQRFELDYWGTSNVKLLRFLLQYQPSGTLRVWSLGITSLSQSIAMLGEDEKNRIQVVTEPEDADFSVTNFRFVTPQQRDFLKDKSWLLIYDVVVDQRIIAGILKKK